MSLFIESICILDGIPQNLKWHQERMNATLNHHFPHCSIDLSKIKHAPGSGKYKCRITYSCQIKSIDYVKYEPRIVNSLKLIEGPELEYSFKYAKRNCLDKLFNMRGDCDDIIIIKNNLVTDTYYANLAFLKDNQWYTPKTPFLKGTKSAKYIHSGRIKAITMTKDDLSQFSKYSLINAMLELGEITGSIEMIQS